MERQRENIRQTLSFLICRSTYKTLTKTPTQAVINMMLASISTGLITLCTAS